MRMHGEKGGMKGWEGGEVWAGARSVCGVTEAERKGEEETLEGEERVLMQILRLSYLFRDILDADGPIRLLGPSHKDAWTGEGGRTRDEEGQGGGGGERHQEGDEGRGEGEAGHLN